ncbi:MAG: translocation/assembly module TamB domain-containing protein [Cyanobacteriota bacterium]|nr:translocation/assembly module TamB domain-containing protein [Cyanobacteriota bacterium]
MKWLPRWPRQAQRDLLVVAAGGGLLALTVSQMDRLLAGAYGRARPPLERQLGRVMGHPLSLGPYQGIGLHGLEVGPSRLLPSRDDRSQASVSGLSVGVDLLASLRQGLPVLGIRLHGARADLVRNRNGGFWSLGRLPPGEPPRLDLRLVLADAARVQLRNLTPGAPPLQLGVTGRVGLQLHEQRLSALAAVQPSGQRGRVQLEGRGTWREQRWQGRVRVADLSLRSLSGQLSGQLNGRFTLSLAKGRPDCQGQVVVSDLRWQSNPSATALTAARAPLRCRGGSLRLNTTAWRYGPWSGTLSAERPPAGPIAGRVSARLPGDRARRPLVAMLQGRWQPGRAWLDRGEIGYGQSRLRLSGEVSKAIDVKGAWSLAGTDLPLEAPPPAWLLPGPLQGDVRLEGSLVAPVVRVRTAPQANALVGPWTSVISWRSNRLRLERLSSPHLNGSASLPLVLQPGRPVRWGNLDARLNLNELPLARLGPLLGTRLSGSLAASGTLTGPLRDLQPNLALRVREPSAGPLRLREDWQGWLRGVSDERRLDLEAERGLEGRIRAQLDPRWQPVRIRLDRAGGWLDLAGRPSGYRWRSSRLTLAGLSLAVGPQSRWRPLQGWLSGAGLLDLQPLAFRGAITVDDPVFLGVGARRIEAQGSYDNRTYQADGTLNTISGGSVTGTAKGRWQGPFSARLEGRGLTPLLARQLEGAWPLWQGREPPPQGRAADLGQGTMGRRDGSLSEQLEELQNAIALRSLRDQNRGNGSAAERLARLQARIDADLNLSGPSLARSHVVLDARGQLWMTYPDRDHSLGDTPLTLRLEGPLEGTGTLQLAGVPLGLLALLMPIPPHLQGTLALRGTVQLGLRRPQLAVDLALNDAGVGPMGIRLQRGRLELLDRNLRLEVAALAEGASNPIELTGTIPLEAHRDELEVRIASRGDGLRFLTNIAGPALNWERGVTDLQLLVRGSLAEPIANGFLKVNDGEGRFIGQGLRDIQATVLFDFEQMVVQRLSARVGSKGWIRGAGTLGLAKPQTRASSLQVSLEDVPFTLPERIRAVAEGSLEIVGSMRNPKLAGRIAIRNGVITAKPGQLAQAAPASGQPARPVSMNQLLEEGWTFSEPLVLLGPEVDSDTAESLRQSVPKVPWLGFDNLRMDLGPDLRVTVPQVANFLTGGSLRLSGQLDPSLRASGVVRLLQGRLNLFTTTFSLDRDAPNVAVFTPSTGLVPYLDIALRTRISDSLSVSGPGRLATAGSSYRPTLQEIEASGGVNPLNRLNLVLVTVAVSGPADRIGESIKLRSNPPLPEERLIALIGGNSLAGLTGGGAGAALATVLGQSLLSPLLGSLSDAFGSRVSFALYPTYVNQALITGSTRAEERVPPQLVLGAEVGIDLTDQINASVLAAPNRSDIPPQITLTYKASELFSLQGSVDTQGAWQTQLQVFFRF